MVIAFGKYRGLDIRDVPDEYLQWLVDSNERTVMAARAEISRREAIEDASDDIVMQIVRRGYREMLKDAHPDTGGDPSTAAAMVEELKAARAALEDLVQSGVRQHAAPPPPPPPKAKAKRKPPNVQWCERCQTYHQTAHA
jgi:hypothetical protein